MKKVISRLCFSSDARQTDPEAAAEDFQLVAVGSGDRPEGAGTPRRDLRHHRPQFPLQSGQTHCEDSSTDTGSDTDAPTFIFISCP